VGPQQIIESIRFRAFDTSSESCFIEVNALRIVRNGGLTVRKVDPIRRGLKQPIITAKF